MRSSHKNDFFSTFQQISVMSTTQHMQNKAGTRVGLAVDEGKLNLKGGKHTWTKIPIVDESDETTPSILGKNLMTKKNTCLVVALLFKMPTR